MAVAGNYSEAFMHTHEAKWVVTLKTSLEYLLQQCSSTIACPFSLQPYFYYSPGLLLIARG